ncbi:SDR family oxidoreductase [Sphingobacterium prati]|uniref:SDR family oxidoreductase n=1 Tax=Sphingobacterium prati TaxID=2737006 RepID=UPI00155717EE|nr:SDR family oxidoreductase [Sphingobacterium prati]NPE47828.1 SDR family oxidoreductase [Sphingobacterium prati]
MEKIALVVGSSGMAGNNLSKELLEQGWTTYGLSRGAGRDIEGVVSLHADLLDVDSLKRALADVHPTHVYFTTWMRRNSESENIEVNSAMVRNLLDVISEKKSVKHVGLVTGLKHYLGPFDAYVTSGVLPETPLREEQPRLSTPNFYYAQEDEVYVAAKRDGFTWSVHRPHTLIGNAIGNQMNMGTTLAVYASICKEENLPFVFPGSQAQWNGLTDVTDAGILAKQVIWASETPTAFNKAFNIVNGDLFRWSWLWQKIAEWFSIEHVGYENEIRPLTKTLEGKEEVWRSMAINYGLEEEDLNKVSSAWHTDLDLSRPIEIMTDMTNSRMLGFKEYYNTTDSFFKLFEQLRSDKIIP